MKSKLNELNNTRLQNIHSHTCAVTDEDYKRIMPKIELLKRLSEVERSIYAVYDLHRYNYLLISDELMKLLGFKEENTGKLNEAEIHYEHIHPEDLPFVLETENLAFQFYSSLSLNEKKDYKLVYDFRTRNKEGVYNRYMHQSIILETDKNGKSWLTLVISDLLSEKATSRKTQRRMINMKTGKLHLFHLLDEESDSQEILSKREREVLHLIACGYDSINISDKLTISVNTVNNHRQNILRKTKTENTTQALLFSKRLGII